MRRTECPISHNRRLASVTKSEVQRADCDSYSGETRPESAQVNHLNYERKACPSYSTRYLPTAGSGKDHFSTPIDVYTQCGVTGMRR